MPASAERYTTCGKELLRDGEHFADVVTPEWSTMMASILNRSDRSGWIDGMREAIEVIGEAIGREAAEAGALMAIRSTLAQRVLDRVKENDRG